MVARAISGTTQGKRRDARERAERIWKVANELGYCPSEIAVALTRGSTKTIGLLLPNLTDMFYAAASEIAMDEAAKYGYSIIIRLTRFRPEIAREGIERFRSSRVAGILYGDDGVSLEPKLITLLTKQKFPILTFGHPNSCNLPSVAPDHMVSIQRAVKMLADKGHASVALASFGKKHIGNKVDSQSFLAACSACKVKGEVLLMEHMNQYAELAAEHRNALLINGKYATRVFLDSISKDPGYQPDLVGFYNEWTWAQASASKLAGVIMDDAEFSVRMAVKTIVKQMADYKHDAIAVQSKFYPKEKFSEIHVLDLANQYLFP